MNRRPLLRVRARSLITALLALAGLLSAAHCSTRTPAQAQTLQHGPFEIVASGRRISTGTFPNIGGNPFARTEVTELGVRWRGQAVRTPGGTQRFWHVLRLMDAPRPALLLVTTGVHLVSELDGQLQVQPLGRGGDGARLQWLDSEAGQPGPVQRHGISRLALAEDTPLRGGRWLMLSHDTVLDVQTLQIHRVEPWIPSGSGRPLAGLSASNDRARMFSPGRSQVVLAGEDHDHGRGQGRVHALLVMDLGGAPSHTLRLERRDTPFADLDDLDAGWIAHYFEWRRDAEGRERLLPRAGVRPRPWRGRLLDFSGGRQEYRVPRARRAFADELRRIVLQQPGAELAPDWIDPRRGIDGFTLRVDGCLLGISAPAGHQAVEGADYDGHVGLFAPSSAGQDLAACNAVMRRTAAAVDAELASGRHDHLIVLD